jgi:uracil-DNA glycosylase
MKVLLVGQNPSRYNTDPDIPFIGTKSIDILCKWLYYLELHPTEYNIINCSNQYDIKFDKGTIEYLAKEIDPTTILVSYDKIIALGNISAKVLTAAGLPYFKLPHPSGRNRKLNDKKWLEKELENAREYIWRLNDERI